MLRNKYNVRLAVRETVARECISRMRKLPILRHEEERVGHRFGFTGDGENVNKISGWSFSTALSEGIPSSRKQRASFRRARTNLVHTSVSWTAYDARESQRASASEKKAAFLRNNARSSRLFPHRAWSGLSDRVYSLDWPIFQWLFIHLTQPSFLREIGRWFFFGTTGLWMFMYLWEISKCNNSRIAYNMKKYFANR